MQSCSVVVWEPDVGVGAWGHHCWADGGKMACACVGLCVCMREDGCLPASLGSRTALEGGGRPALDTSMALVMDGVSEWAKMRWGCRHGPGGGVAWGHAQFGPCPPPSSSVHPSGLPVWEG